MLSLFCHHLFTFMSFQNCMACLLSVDHKRYKKKSVLVHTMSMGFGIVTSKYPAHRRPLASVRCVTICRLHQSVSSSALHFPGSFCLLSWTHSLISHLFLVLIICFTCFHSIMFDSPVYLVPSVSFSLCRSLNLWTYVTVWFLSVPFDVWSLSKVFALEFWLICHLPQPALPPPHPVTRWRPRIACNPAYPRTNPIRVILLTLFL